jgi:sarcinarray family protein
MYLRIFVIILIGLVLNLQNVSAEENDYGIVKAWFAEINATDQTAEGVKLKVGEPSELKVEVISKIDGNVYIKLYEPGFTNAFKVISGSSTIGTTVPNSGVSTGWAKTYSWIVAPNGDWKNGNAPLNIFVQFSKIENGKKKGEQTIDFTIANPYILDEQYSGSTPAQTTGAAPPSPTGTSSKPQQTPFLTAAGTIAVMLGVWMWKKRRTY